LPAGWTTAPLQTGGSSAVADGSLSVDGVAALSPSPYNPGHSVEFVATFTANGQNAGFGEDKGSLPPYAVFGVKPDGQLYARTAITGKSLETMIPGNWLNTRHHFRIDWTATGATYSIDGMPRLTHAVAFKANTVMRPAAADFVAGSGALSVDWMRMSPYAASGGYSSPVFDAGVPVVWEMAGWIADRAAGTNIVIEVRTGTTPTPDSVNWTAFRAITSGTLIGETGQYAQYRVTLTTTAPNTTPALKEVTLTFKK
jgi:hypothetical protein